MYKQVYIHMWQYGFKLGNPCQADDEIASMQIFAYINLLPHCLLSLAWAKPMPGAWAHGCPMGWASTRLPPDPRAPICGAHAEPTRSLRSLRGRIVLFSRRKEEIALGTSHRGPGGLFRRGAGAAEVPVLHCLLHFTCCLLPTAYCLLPTQ